MTIEKMPGHMGNADAQFVKPSASLYTILSVAQSAKCSYVANVAYLFILALHSLWSLFWYTSLLTRALLGGGRLNAPPSGFSRIAKKRRRAAPPGFHPPYPPSFPQLLWKFRPKAMWGQVTRSGQVTQLQNNFPIAPRLQCFRESYETFGIWWGHQCLQNVYLGYLISVTSGQVIFATSPL